MEFIFELLLELILEGSIEVSKNKKVSKIIRYPLIVLLIVFFLLVIGIIFYTGIIFLKDYFAYGILIIILGIIMLIMSIIKFKKVYLKQVNQEKWDNENQKSHPLKTEKVIR